MPKLNKTEILELTHRALQDWTRGTRSHEFRNVESRQRVLTLFTTYCIARTQKKPAENDLEALKYGIQAILSAKSIEPQIRIEKALAKIQEKENA